MQGLEFSFIDDVDHVALVRTLQAVFAEVHTYSAHIPAYLAGWGFIVASDWFRPAGWTAETIDATIDERLGTWLDHLNGPFLKACFAPCNESLRALARPGPLLEDGVPFVPPPDIEEIVPEMCIRSDRRGADPRQEAGDRLPGVAFAQRRCRRFHAATRSRSGTLLPAGGRTY